MYLRHRLRPPRIRQHHVYWLVGAAHIQDCENSAAENFDIQPNRPVLNIVKIDSSASLPDNRLLYFTELLARYPGRGADTELAKTVLALIEVGPDTTSSRKRVLRNGCAPLGDLLLVCLPHSEKD